MFFHKRSIFLLCNIKIERRVQYITLIAYLNVQVVARWKAGRTHFADNVAFLHLVTYLYIYLGKVSVKGNELVAVVDDNIVSITAATAAGLLLAVVMRAGGVYLYDLATAWSVNRRAMSRRNVKSRVCLLYTSPSPRD